jgi:hypothetical protein
VNGYQFDNSTPGSGAAYVFVRSGGVWSQQAYLKASNAGVSDLFGASVAISGHTVVVGANSESSSAMVINGHQFGNGSLSSGAAYVFIRGSGAWNQQAYLKASNTGVGDYFGSSVAVSGDTVVVGAFGEDNGAGYSGAAYVFAGVEAVPSRGACCIDGVAVQLFLNECDTLGGMFFGEGVASEEVKCDPPCPTDIMPLGGDGAVTIADISAVMSSFGPCP